MSDQPTLTADAQERGPWSAGKWDDGRIFVQSADFTHDVLLYVNGDFTDHAEEMRYAEEIAKRLNAWKPS